MLIKKIIAISAASALLVGCATKPTTNIEEEVDVTTEQENGMLSYVNEELGYSFMYPSATLHDDKVEILKNGNVVMIEGAVEAYSTEFLEKEGSDYEKKSGTPLAFLVEDVASEEELNAFIVNTYGEDCSAGEMTESDVPGEFWVDINAGDLVDEIGFPKCFVNYITYLKYSPEKGKVASWDLGQDYNLGFEEENDKGRLYDELVSESFRFL
jgi:hypothetical protein